MLRVRKTILSIISILLALISFSQDSTSQVNKWKLSGFPIAYYTPETGVAAGALGLLHEDKLNMERRVGACTRFLLEHINKEMKNTDQRAGKGPSSSTGSSGSSGK